MKGRIRRPSPALIVAFCALVAALGGTAIALPGRNNIDRNDLKKRVVGAYNVTRNAIRGYQLAPSAVNNIHNRLYKSSGLKKATAAASQAAAPQIFLLKRGPLVVYGKCYETGANVAGTIYVRTTQPGAVVGADGTDIDGDGAEPAAGYVNPGEDESNHDLASISVGNNATGNDQDPFAVIHGNRVIEGRAAVFVKHGDTGNGNGPYGAGDRCLFHAFYAGIG